MAPLWGSSWSSTWTSASSYATLKNGEQGIATSSLDSSHLKPSVGQILMSKRVRYASISLASFALFFLTFRNYDRIPSIESFRGNTAASSITSNCAPPTIIPSSLEDAHIDWSRFAYTQYVTNGAYLCNSAMIFETLFRLGSKADRVMMYPESMMDPGETKPSSEEAKLLVKARDEYKVKLVPISIQRRAGTDATWAESFTKLLAFNQTQYRRVLNVDSDSTILQTMDELFLLPPCPVAMPRAYWLFPENKILSSQIMLIQPSAVEFDRIVKKMDSAGHNDYDMEIVNQLYVDTAMILPHRPYDLLTGEFRGDNHENYLGTDREEWDPVTIFNEAKFLHFSDWPVPKPWLPMSDSMRQDKQPKCVERNGQEDCSARDLWNGFYDDFTKRRSAVCGNKMRARR